MKRPAIFFDRDNTLIVSDGYLGDPAGVALVPGAADAIARARSLGYATVVFSNQSGVARGMFDETAVHAVNARLDDLLAEANPAAVIDRHEFCPYHPEATVDAYRQESDLRKPKPGMILRAAERLALDLSRSWVIGDAARDLEAGRAAGCRTILFKSPNLAPSPAAAAPHTVEPDYTVTTFPEAIAFIEQNTESAAPSADPVPQPIGAPAEIHVPTAAVPLAEIATTPPPAIPSSTKTEQLLEQILYEIRHTRDHVPTDFSVSKLFAGITQVMALAALFLSYLRREDPSALIATLLTALTIQTLTIALLIMGRQK